ncbi:UDP-N-acetylmuramate--L-alanine ligase [Actinomyces bovis]|uniref:UDP-N-acetylmuramate--L-alanine ligase n=1 Tax=Actinomyces bovis TaxID=1658 RepID=A0ABY1VQ51_9ACTO|nr:UDP-N-acetylmuramate--L-alanine ligase [Actinomyces bovis]SPT53933.1 UDP-N-acetylmuramate--L-alanine ligase [Actinomyces bovis]VEG53431.1 UDP-N-acetylmuramate--L-alanine ligase [Actinomyces israelii]
MGSAEPQQLAPLEGSQFHLIGVGGAGMSVVAALLAERGAVVSGSDAQDSEALERLRQAGVEVWVGHDAAAVCPEATVVVSTAIKDTNPELAVARSRGQEVIHRSQALALAAQGRDFVAVAGAHGKTTTSGMLAEALTQAGADPSFAIGGVVCAIGTGAHLGQGQAFVAEADESDCSFLNYHPRIEVVTNVEPDHLDNYGSTAAFEQAFLDFSARLVPGGLLVACADDSGALRLARAAASAGTRVQTFGTTKAADIPGGPVGEGHVQLTVLAAKDSGTSARLELQRTDGAIVGPVELELSVPGAHVALDAAGAWAAGLELGVDPAVMAHSLGAFGGTKRRFEDRGEVAGVRVVDDYAHHPTEIEALMRTARAVAQARGGRVLALFQPHLFSRTQNFAQRFGAALSQADLAVVTDIYPARERAEDFPGIDGGTVAQYLPAGRGRFVRGREEAAHAIAAAAKPGDLLLTIGAGDVTELGPIVLADLAAGAGASTEN